MGKRITAVDLRDDGFSIVEMVGGRKGPYIKSFAADYWESSDLRKRSNQLAQVFAEKRMRKNRIVAALPLSRGRWCRFSLPDLTGDALEKAVFLSIQEQVPWSSAEAVFGFQTRKNGNKALIDAFVFPERAIQSGLELSKNAGLTLKYFVPRPYGFINFFRFHAQNSPDNAVVACIDFSPQETELTLFDRNGLLLPRSFPNPLTGEKAYDTTALAGELRLLQLKLRREGKVLTRCYLSGWMPGLNPEALTPVIAANLDLEEEATGFILQDGLLSVTSREGSKTPGAITAIGLALQGLGYGSAPRIRSEDAVTSKRKTLYFRVIAALNVFFLMGGLYFQYSVDQRHKWVLKERARSEQTMEDRRSMYKSLWSNRASCLEFFKEWVKVVPEGTVITALVMEGNEVKEVSGYTPSFSALYQGVNSSSYLRNLRIRGGIRRHSAEQEGFRLSGYVGEGN